MVTLMIFDHPDIDIVLMVERKKLLHLLKIWQLMLFMAHPLVYGSVAEKGVIAYETIQGGNVYGSLEGQLLEMKNPEMKDKMFPTYS